MFKEFATKNRMLATICTLQTLEQAVFQRLFHLFGGCPGCKTILCSLDKLSTPAHKGINCDGCRIKDIFTRRYKCNVCHDYDLCESCYDNKIYAPVTNKVVSHRASHQMTLCTSVLFFTNSVLNVQTANGIIKEAVTNDLKRIQNLLPTEEERRFFGNIMKERNGEGLQEMLAHMKKAEALKAQTNPDLHQATQRHAAMSNDLRNGPAAMGKLDEATLARAEFAHETRKGGSLAHKKSTNTVFAIGQEELQRRIDQRIGADQQVGRHDITLRGTYQAVDWEINPLTGTKTRTYYEVRDPVFGVDNGKAIHLNSKGTYSKVEIPGQRFYEAYQKVDGIPAVYCARRRRNSGANAQ
ncbi:unnamed protein product, partial [Mesorhabditis spiculigera]